MSEVSTSAGPQGTITAVADTAPTEVANQVADEVQAEALPKAEETAPKVDDKLASKFAALTRKERALREQQNQLKKQQAEIEQLRKQFDERGSSEKSLADRLKSEPLKVLSEAGLTFEDLSQIVLNEGNPTPEMLIKRTRDEIESKYTKELEELKRSMIEKEKAAEEAKVDAVKQQYMAELTEYVNSNEKYELIRANDSVQLVYDVVEAFYQESGKVLSLQEAADQVESYLEDEAKKIFELKKFKQTSPKQDQQPGQPKQTAPTLSNAMASQAPQKGERKLSKEESIKEAAKLIRWEE